MENNAEIQKREELDAPTTSERIFQGKRINLRIDRWRIGERERVAEIIEHPGAVVILPKLNDKFLFVQQWRRATGQILLELPAGTLETGEDPLYCAQRELQEETGYRAEHLVPYGGFFSAPGFSSEYLHLFFADDLVADPLPADEDEKIDLIALGWEEVCSAMRDHTIRDAKTLAALCLRHFYE